MSSELASASFLAWVCLTLAAQRREQKQDSGVHRRRSVRASLGPLVALYLRVWVWLRITVAGLKISSPDFFPLKALFQLPVASWLC